MARRAYCHDHFDTLPSYLCVALTRVQHILLGYYSTLFGILQQILSRCFKVAVFSWRFALDFIADTDYYYNITLNKDRYLWIFAVFCQNHTRRTMR